MSQYTGPQNEGKRTCIKKEIKSHPIIPTNYRCPNKGKSHNTHTTTPPSTISTSTTTIPNPPGTSSHDPCDDSIESSNCNKDDTHDNQRPSGSCTDLRIWIQKLGNQICFSAQRQNVCNAKCQATSSIQKEVYNNCTY